MPRLACQSDGWSGWSSVFPLKSHNITKFGSPNPVWNMTKNLDDNVGVRTSLVWGSGRTDAPTHLAVLGVVLLLAASLMDVLAVNAQQRTDQHHVVIDLMPWEITPEGQQMWLINIHQLHLTAKCDMSRASWSQGDETRMQPRPSDISEVFRTCFFGKKHSLETLGVAFTWEILCFFDTDKISRPDWRSYMDHFEEALNLGKTPLFSPWEDDAKRYGVANVIDVVAWLFGMDAWIWMVDALGVLWVNWFQMYIDVFFHVFFHPLMEGPELQRASQASQNQPMNQLGRCPIPQGLSGWSLLIPRTKAGTAGIIILIYLVGWAKQSRL